MSELKAGTIKTPYREGIAFVVDDTFYDKEEGETLFYLKSEADKVIEEKDEIIDELKEHIDELQKATDSAWSKVNAIYDELRHQKYKRCLAMARWCRESLRLMRTYEVTEDFWNLEPGQDAEYFCKKGDFYRKWRKRWLALAEKFKEPK